MATPNILLVLTDQHRFDTLGVNGSSVCRTPALDTLAGTGVNFRQAYSVCGLCTPARASIYSGLLPHRHRLTRNVDEDDPNPAAIPQSMPTLAERLTPLGYRNHYIESRYPGDCTGHCRSRGPRRPGRQEFSAHAANHPYLQR